MDREEYTMMVKLQNQIPPKQEMPEGQKFHIGEIVKINNPESWFSKISFEEDKDRLFEIQYSYQQKFNGGMPHHNNSYSLKHLWEDNSSAWYEGNELELVKGIDEITEEKDLSEYKRLNIKYNNNK